MASGSCVKILFLICFLVCKHVWMCVCRHVLYVNNAYYMFQVSTLWMMCDWKIQDCDLCNVDFYWVFFIMCPSCMSIILILLVIFNCMYKGFLDLVWLRCLICGLEHEFVSFNKPYLYFLCFTHGRMMLKIMSLPNLLQRILFCLELQF